MSHLAPCYSVSIVNFEQVNDGWEVTQSGEAVAYHLKIFPSHLGVNGKEGCKKIKQVIFKKHSL